MDNDRAFHLINADVEVNDCRDVLLVIETVLNGAKASLSADLRDALSTVARLGYLRAEDADRSLQNAMGGARV